MTVKITKSKMTLVKLMCRFCLAAVTIALLFGCKATHIYALMGQSNMAGRGLIDSVSNTYQSHRVLMYTKDDSVITARHPLHFDKPIAQVGPGLMFGYELSQRTKGRIVLVPCAVGGTSIKLWKPGMFDKSTDTHPYDDAIHRLKIASKEGKITGVIWHQGEADRGMENYLEELVTLIKRIRAFAGDEDLPFVVGELGYFLDNVETFNKNLNQLPNLLDHTAVVSAEGLTHKGDNIHFDARSAEILGKRYAEAMIGLLKDPEGGQVIQAEYER